MAGGSITGVVGHIKWHDYTAAAINGYTVTRSGTDWFLRGTVVLSDAYKMAQRPLTFVATTDKGAWRWPIDSFHLAEGAFTATLGSLEP